MRYQLTFVEQGQPQVVRVKEVWQLPDAYTDTSRAFPVVYMLDAERAFGMAADALTA
jgi:predicted alpha/beta superfamily hydrolase